jgi:hypothetical protein
MPAPQFLIYPAAISAVKSPRRRRKEVNALGDGKKSVVSHRIWKLERKAYFFEGR